jgi:hypothetical protein
MLTEKSSIALVGYISGQKAILLSNELQQEARATHPRPKGKMGS